MRWRPLLRDMFTTWTHLRIMLNHPAPQKGHGWSTSDTTDWTSIAQHTLDIKFPKFHPLTYTMFIVSHTQGHNCIWYILCKIIAHSHELKDVLQIAILDDCAHMTLVINSRPIYIGKFNFPHVLIWRGGSSGFNSWQQNFLAEKSHQNVHYKHHTKFNTLSQVWGH